MSYSIIVEAGATKSDWVVVDCHGNRVKQFKGRGINVSAMRMEEVKDILSEYLVTELVDYGIQGMYIYVAGVVTDAIRSEVSAYLQTISAIKEIEINDDLMGAARAVCGRNPGIVAILGTGSNACSYDGKTVTRNVYSGGYVLGDEGSAATLGKMFLSDYIKGLVPSEVADDFAKEYDASYAAIVEGVYRSSSPSGYLGSLAPFILKHKDNQYISNMIRQNFLSFFDRTLAKYDVEGLPVGFVGGFAYACRDLLAPILKERGIRITRILKSPVDGLVDYHSGC